VQFEPQEYNCCTNEIGGTTVCVAYILVRLRSKPQSTEFVLQLFSYWHQNMFAQILWIYCRLLAFNPACQIQDFDSTGCIRTRNDTSLTEAQDDSVSEQSSQLR